MAEVIVQDGTWTFDGEILRIVPGRDRRVNKLRQSLGEIVVPLEAIAGVAVEPGRKGGHLRLRLRDGADPFLQVAGGKLADDADPYRLAVPRDTVGSAEYLVDEVRTALMLEQIVPAPCDRYLIRAPAAPLSATAGDGSVTFDGASIRIEWTDWAETMKKTMGPQEIALEDVAAVEWMPIISWTNGYLRFRVAGGSALQPKHDPHAITWGWQREGGTTALLAAAVVARRRHPHAPEAQDATALTAAEQAPAEASDDHDALVRRLRELGDLHRDGVLTDGEFSTAKDAILRRL